MTVEIPPDYMKWPQAAQEKALQGLRNATERDWRPFYCPARRCDGKPHGPMGKSPIPWDFPHGRTSQRPPPGDWLTWLFMAGRGSGKSRSGSEWVHRLARNPVRIALLSPTGPDIRDTQVEGESGILATAPPGRTPEWEPSKRKLTWPSGAVAYGYSMEEPDRLRGKQHHFAWLDEPAHAPLIVDVWDNLLFGLRLGDTPRVLATTTPLPTKWMRELVDDPTTALTTGSTYDNIDNLASTFRDIVIARYEGTRKGRQEIHGALLQDVEGAMWNADWIKYLPADEDPELVRIVVAIDPAGTARDKSDETGIVVVGTDGENYYTLADYSGRYSPAGWANRALTAADVWSADVIVAEKNYGGDMVRAVIEGQAKERDNIYAIETVTSRRGKVLRADPVSALYEKGKGIHLQAMPELEDQMTTWIAGHPSPDRIDALVHGVTHLAQKVAPTTVADPTRLNNVVPLIRRSA